MDKIEKALSRLSQKERELVGVLLAHIMKGDVQEIDVKKLKGYKDIFRVRKGKIRFIYREAENGKIFVLAIERRNEKTYKDF